MLEMIQYFPSWIIEYKLIIVFSTAILISTLLIPQIIRYSLKYGWVDVPDSRKIHIRSIPNLGGVAIFFGLFIASVFWIKYFRSNDFIFIITCVLILLFTGIFDDLKGLKAKKKLFIQIITAVIVVSGGIRITSFQGLFGIFELPVVVQYFFSVFVIVGVINAYNLMDGIDGLAGGIGVINFSILGYVFYSMHHIAYALLAFAVAGSLIGFLIYNFNPAKIFMGDTGALIIGFLTVVLGIKAIEFNLSPVKQMYLSQNMLVFISSIMFLPVFDTIRVFAMRVWKGKSPFTPGKDHIHHILLKKGLKPVEVTITLYALNILVILVGLTVNYYKPINLFINAMVFNF